MNDQTNNVDALDDPIAYVRKKMEQEKIEENRKARLKSMLNESENKDVNKVLYEQGGLKEMLEADPQILDTETAIRLALQAASSNYKNKIEREEAKKNQERQEKQKQMNKDIAPLTQQGAPQGGNDKKDKDDDWTKWSREKLVEYFKTDPKYALRAEELAWTCFGARNPASSIFKN